MSRPPRLIFLISVIAACSVYASIGSAEQPRRYDFENDVLPILKTRCGKCHGEELQEGNIRFDQLSTDLVNDRAAAQSWLEARNAINASEMPPEDETPLTDSERQTLLAWISTSLREAIEQQKSTGGRNVLRRLNRIEYQHTMTDLLGIEMDYTRDLPPDGISVDGFRNNGQSLQMSAIQLAFYLDTARRALRKVLVTGPPPKVYRHQFDQSNVGGWRGPTEFSNRLERAQKFLVKMVDDYPEQGEFRIRVQATAGLQPEKGFPVLEVAVGYRPDTEVHLRVAATQEVVTEQLRQYEFRGRIENFPLPVRGQGKYPGLVIRLRNIYDDGTPIPDKLETVKDAEGKERKAFRNEPNMPHLQIQSVEFEGPHYASWPPTTHQRILFDSPLREQDEAAYIREVLKRFMTRAYRRPPLDQEISEMATFLASIRESYPELEDAMRETLALVLIKPDFLYLLEPAGNTKRQLNDWELATRLSYFLWSTMPDDRLLELAKTELLSDQRILAVEVDRMLKDERAARFRDQFVAQWLELESVDVVSVDRERFPDFHDALKSDLVRESTELFAHLLQHNASAAVMLDCDYSFMNERVARHYGIEGVLGRKFRQVKFSPQQRRGGLLTHGSVLLANSNGRDSHPIRRAVWLRKNLLGDPPAPPPPDVPTLEEADPEFAKLSLREKLEVHREKESCAACHRNIDPWGIALENFDAVGRWRESIKNHEGNETAVVADDVLPNGTRLDGVDQLKSYLLENRRSEFAEALVRSLASYALGRSLELTDEDEIQRLTNQFDQQGLPLRDLVQQIVASSAFRTK